MATDLNSASLDAAADLGAKFTSGSLNDDMEQFCTDVAAAFTGEGTAAERTVTNWIPLIRAAVQGLGSGGISYSGLPGCIDVIFRICQAARWADARSRISSAQATAILDAYNDNFT